MEGTIRIAAGSIAVGVLVLAIKFVAWWVTGSVALYSDALESLVNVATAVAALLAVRLAAEPPDANHAYGHSKVEYFSAAFAGALIIVAAIAILREAWAAFLAPRMLDAPALGLGLSAVASAVNLAWARVLIAAGERRRSPALTADGRHLMSDVVTSVGVIVGILLAIRFDRPVLDPLLAALVAVNILWSGWRVIRESLGGLMDEAAPQEMLDRIRDVISQEAEGAIEAHDVRTRVAGRITFIDFHLVVPGRMTVEQSHEICDRIEAALRRTIEDATVTIHVEPESKAKHCGVPVV
jgi:cation diffusion facilitator family transporter